jgi:hypothetical protein
MTNPFITLPTNLGLLTTTDLPYILGDKPVLSNNITTPNTKIDYSSGYFPFQDKTGIGLLVAGTVNFAINGLNGLDTGSIVANTSYHIYAIYNPTTFVTGGIASTNASSPTLPSGFTKYKRIGSLLTDSTGNIRQWKWFKNGCVEYTIQILDFAGSLPTSPTFQAVSVPSGINVKVLGRFFYTHGNGSGSNAILFSNQPSLIPTSTIFTRLINYYSVNGEMSADYDFEVLTNNSAFYKSVTHLGVTTAHSLTVYTKGYLDIELNS